MNETLSRQDVSRMLPAYVLGTLEPDKMLACQSYLRNRADRPLLLQYLHAEEMVTQLTWTLPQMPLPAWVKEQLMARVGADCASKRTYKQWAIRRRTWHIMPS